MSKKKGSRGIPVDMSDFSEKHHEHGSGAYVLPRASGAPKALTLEDFVVLSARPNKSNKERIQAAAAAAAAEKAEKEAEATRKAESDRLHKESTNMHQPPKSVTCALCKKTETLGEAIAHKWKKHPFRFANQGICAACDAATVPFTASPKLVWAKPDHLSTRHTKLLEALDRTKTPPNALKAQVVAYSEFEPPMQKRRPNIMRPLLSAAFLTPPESHAPSVGSAGVIPFTKNQIEKLTKSINSRNRGGTKSKSKSKSRSRSRSRL